MQIAFINVGIVLNKVVLLMEPQIEDQSQVPVFLMKDLKKPYQEKLSYLEALPDFIDHVHATRLKMENLKTISGLCEQVNGKLSMLSLDGENGRALFKISKNSLTDEGMMISKAAKSRCLKMQKFLMGIFSQSRMVESVPLTLDAVRLQIKRAQLQSR